MSFEPIGRPNSLAYPSVAGSRPRQHLHRRRFAATVGAEEAEDLAPLDPEIDVIDRDEIAEPPRQSLGLDRGRLIRSRDAGPNDDFLMQRAFLPATAR